MLEEKKERVYDVGCGEKRKSILCTKKDTKIPPFEIHIFNIEEKNGKIRTSLSSLSNLSNDQSKYLGHK